MKNNDDGLNFIFKGIIILYALPFIIALSPLFILYWIIKTLFEIDETSIQNLNTSNSSNGFIKKEYNNDKLGAQKQISSYINSNAIQLGDTITYKNMKTGKENTVKISSNKTDFNNGVINVNTPLAKALLGSIKDEELEVNASTITILKVIKATNFNKTNKSLLHKLLSDFHFSNNSYSLNSCIAEWFKNHTNLSDKQIKNFCGKNIVSSDNEIDPVKLGILTYGEIERCMRASNTDLVPAEHFETILQKNKFNIPFFHLLIWLVNNTKLNHNQIAKFCELEDNEKYIISQAKGLKTEYNPIESGLLTQDEIKRCETQHEQDLGFACEYFYSVYLLSKTIEDFNIIIYDITKHFIDTICEKALPQFNKLFCNTHNYLYIPIFYINKHFDMLYDEYQNKAIKNKNGEYIDNAWNKELQYFVENIVLQTAKNSLKKMDKKIRKGIIDVYVEMVQYLFDIIVNMKRKVCEDIKIAKNKGFDDKTISLITLNALNGIDVFKMIEQQDNIEGNSFWDTILISDNNEVKSNASQLQDMRFNDELDDLHYLVSTAENVDDVEEVEWQVEQARNKLQAMKGSLSDKQYNEYQSQLDDIADLADEAVEDAEVEENFIMDEFIK